MVGDVLMAEEAFAEAALEGGAAAAGMREVRSRGRAGPLRAIPAVSSINDVGSVMRFIGITLTTRSHMA